MPSCSLLLPPDNHVTNCFLEIKVCFTPLTADAYMCPDGLPPDCTSMIRTPKQVAVTSSSTDYVAISDSLRYLTKSKLYNGTYWRKKWICRVQILDIASSYKYILKLFFGSLAFLVVTSGMEWSSGRRAHSKASLRLGWQRWRMHKYVKESGVVHLYRRFNMLINMFTYLYWIYAFMFWLFVVTDGFSTAKSFFWWLELLPSCTDELTRMLTLLA